MEVAISITGSGIISAIGNNKEETLRSLRDKRTGIAPVHYLETAHREFPVGEVKLSDDELHTALSIPADAITSRTTMMGIHAIREALQEAKLSDVQKSRVVLISGTTVGGMDCTERYFLDMMERGEHLDLLEKHECGASTDEMAAYFGISSHNTYTISTACSSAANAIILGANMLKMGLADIVIAGGSESLSKFHFNGFNTLMILDREQCRPFDETRAGLNLGEGAAFVVLERQSDAERRGAQTIATLSGYGNACDAFHQTATSPEGEGAYRAMSEALRSAELQPADIQYINAHGTGTPNNDQCEGVAIRRVYGETLPPISSTKSFTGHTTSASGSIETVICLLALQHQFIPANLGWSQPMTEGIVPTMGEERAALTHVMCNSFGFGGNDSSLILSKEKALMPHCQEDGSHVLTCRGRETTDNKFVYVRAVCEVKAGENADVTAFIPKLVARRMCRLLKTSVYTAMTVLKEADITTPDAIIAATSRGMLENSEKFLVQMCREGEEMLGPTLFMQSTHNTIAGQLAMLTKAHGYNTTYTQGERSRECVLADAVIQLQRGAANNVLVSIDDETTDLYAQMQERHDGMHHDVGATSTAMLLTTNPDRALYELDINQLLSRKD